jgi:hypothetical protein
VDGQGAGGELFIDGSKAMDTFWWNVGAYRLLGRGEITYRTRPANYQVSQRVRVVVISSHRVAAVREERPHRDDYA